MNTEILHILNGDSSLNQIEKTLITGERMVWREVLVQGPLFYLLDSELFWEMRSQFMEKAFDSKLSDYRRKVMTEFAKLRRFKGEEIVLWFEYDLFCQVNMIALLSYILRAKKTMKISMICVGDYPGYDKKVGLGQLPHTEYDQLFKNRTTLEKADLLVADRAWMLFCGKQVSQFHTIPTTTFIYLKDALMAAKKVFRKKGNKSALEEEMISLMNEQNMTHREIIRYLLVNDTILGFGDLQYEYLLKRLESN